VKAKYDSEHVSKCRKNDVDFVSVVKLMMEDAPCVTWCEASRWRSNKSEKDVTWEASDGGGEGTRWGEDVSTFGDYRAAVARSTWSSSSSRRPD